MDEVTDLSQQELLYVTFQPDERTIVACDLDGCELLRVPFADETEAAGRQAQDVVAASVESLFPTARPLWASEPSAPVGDDYNELVAASLQQLYEEERRSWAQKERLRARKDRRLARELQLQEAMRAPAAALPTAGLGASAWRSTPLQAADSRLPAGEYPSLSTGLDAAVQRVVLRVATREERRGDARPEPPSPGGLRRLMRVAEGPGRRRKSLVAAEEEDDAGRDPLSTKSFRKLIQDMLSKGWQPVKQGNTGHYKFERFVEPLGGMKQMLMLASTPSDRRYIWTLRAAIARADREVEEKLQERAQTGLA